MSKVLLLIFYLTTTYRVVIVKVMSNAAIISFISHQMAWNTFQTFFASEFIITT